MNHNMFSLALTAAIVVAAPAAAAEPRTLASELMAADRAFSNAGIKANIADAIGSMLTENAVMPTPKLDFAIGKAAVIGALKANPANATANVTITLEFPDGTTQNFPLSISPFSQTIWNVNTNASDTVAITSSDANAGLPANAPLTAGTGTFSITLNTAGTRTLSTSSRFMS